MYVRILRENEGKQTLRWAAVEEALEQSPVLGTLTWLAAGERSTGQHLQEDPASLAEMGTVS